MRTTTGRIATALLATALAAPAMAVTPVTVLAVGTGTTTSEATPVAVTRSDDGTLKDANGIRYRLKAGDTVSVISDTDITDPFLPPGAGIGLGTATYTGEVVIPAQVTIDNAVYSVTEIEGGSFKGTAVTKVSLPNTVTSISGPAFNDCAQLVEVDLQEGLLEIQGGAFEGCSALSKLTIPSTVTKLGTSVFGDCKSLESLHIPAGVTDNLVKALVGNTLYPHLDKVTIAEGSPYDIEGGVLYKGTTAELYMGPAESVVVRAGTTAIASDGFGTTGITGAFAQNYGMKSIVLPDSITEIPQNAFYQCVNLQSVQLPSGLKTIGQRAFYDTDIVELTLPDSVTSIGVQAFQGCQELESVDFSESLTSLGESCFEDCVALKSVAIPEGVTEIPNSAFMGCLSLESVSLPEGLTSIGRSAFNLTAENESGEYTNDDPKLAIINIPSTVKTIGNRFLNGIKPNGETVVVFQGATPPEFSKNALSGITGDGRNKPTVLYPADARDAYTAADSPLAGVIPDGESTAGKFDYKLESADAIKVCPGESKLLDFKAELPEGAKLVFVSSDPEVATVDSAGKVTGVKAGAASITASITMKGVKIASAGSDVTVGHALTGVPAKEPTATEAGNIAYWTCSACGKLFADDAASKEIGLADTVIPAKGQEPAAKHTVTVVYGNGKPSARFDVEDGELFVEPAAPEREGYEFAGWFTVKNADGTLEGEYDFSKPVTSDLTIWAGWVPAESEDEKPSTDEEQPDGPEGKTEEKSEAEKGNALPQTGDASALPMAANAIAGAAALAVGYVATKRRK